MVRNLDKPQTRKLDNKPFRRIPAHLGWGETVRNRLKHRSPGGASLYLKGVAAMACFMIVLGAIYTLPVKADWTMFRGDLNRTGVASGTAVVAVSSLWNFSSGDIQASPVVANGIVYIVSLDKNLYALNATTGVKLWNFSDSYALYSAPSIVEGIVYFGGLNCVWALNGSSGMLIWRAATISPNCTVQSSPAVVDGVVYVGCSDQNLYALSADTGNRIWAFQSSGQFYSSPAVVDGIVYAGSSKGYLYAVDAYSGRLLWSFQTGGPIDSSPAVVDGIIYFGSWDGNVYAVNVANHAKLWSYSTGDQVSCSAAVANGVVYIGSEDNNFYALDATNGTKLWSYTVENVIFSSPVVVDSVVYFGDGNGNVLALDAANGTQIWCYTTVGGVLASPAIVNGIMYIGALRGPQQYSTIPTLYALAASSTPGPFKTMHNRFPLPTIQPTPTWSPNPTATPSQSPMPTSQATPKPTAKPSPTPPSSTTLTAITENGTTLFLELSGNITESQVSRATLAVNQSAATTTLSFTLNGQSGTVGFSNITIPKAVVLTGSTPMIWVDTQPAQNQGFTQDALNYYVWYTAHFSSHQIAIVFSADTLPIPTTINGSLGGQITWTQIIFGVLGALVIVVVTVGVLILVNRERRRNP